MKPCVFCGADVTSTKPDVDFCAMCFYGGRWVDRKFAALLADISALGVTDCAPMHTGGGCFALNIAVPGGYLWATADEDGSLPASEAGPWWVGKYVTGEDDDEGEIIAEHLDRSALLATIQWCVS